MNDNVLKIIKKFDLIIINETHFGTRTRDFILIGRSQPSASKIPGGGVTIFKNKSCTGNIEMVYDGLHDCVYVELAIRILLLLDYIFLRIIPYNPTL